MFIPNVYAHNASFIDYSNKKSMRISSCNDLNYAYHKEEDKYHFHEVIWDKDLKEWEIVDYDTQYDDDPCLTNNKEKITVKLDSCTDGDTIKVIIDKKVVPVRFLAIDTLELKSKDEKEKSYAQEAKDFTCTILSKANKITLEYDPKSDKTDKYGRELAWVYADDVLVQDSLISNGLAKVAYLYGKYEYIPSLYIKEDEAKAKRLGIWSLQSTEVLEEQIIELKPFNELSTEEKIEKIVYVVIVVSFSIITILKAITKKQTNN